MARPADSWSVLFSGRFHLPDAPSCVYVARMKKFREAKKVGMCQLPFRQWRWGDLEYGTVLIQPEAPRLIAWLAEQRVLAKTSERGQRWCPPRLLQQRWPGYTELRVTPVPDLKRYVRGALHCLEDMGPHRFVERFFDLPEMNYPSFDRWMQEGLS